MILETMKLTNDRIWPTDWTDADGNSVVCVNRFARLFTIPNVDEIWVSIRDRPTRHTMGVKVTAFTDEYTPTGVDVKAENGLLWNAWDTNECLDLVLSKYIGKTIYVEVEYYA